MVLELELNMHQTDPNPVSVVVVVGFVVDVEAGGPSIQITNATSVESLATMPMIVGILRVQEDMIVEVKGHLNTIGEIQK